MNKGISFLERYKMASTDIDVSSTLDKFEVEINKGLAMTGPIGVCSIPMIPTYLDPLITVRKDEKVIVIDAGGTNLRVGLAYYDGDRWHLDDVIEDKMPGVDREYSKKEFFSYIAERVKPFLDKARDIGFCFSYRVKMDKTLDGRLIAWAKEIKAKEVVGEFIGKSLLEELEKYSSVYRKIVVLNDTTSVLLGGMMMDKAKACDKYVGAIYGTGFNCCYEEDVKNIKKLNETSSGLMIINTETGNFNGFNRGLFDEELTKNSIYPDEALTEKMSSGKYLATLIYQALVKAKEDNLFSGEVKIPDTSFDLPEVSKFLTGNSTIKKIFTSDSDEEVFRNMALELIKRASKIVATTISAFVKKSEGRNVGIIIEGSTFYKLPTFKESFVCYLEEILSRFNIKYQLFDGRDKILLGAAIAAMAK